MNIKEIAVIGGGIIGRTTSFYLARRGHKVTLIDPILNQEKNTDGFRSGSNASLGVLMGNIFSRSSGRSWQIRKRCIELWPKLINELSTKNNILKLENPLIRLASTKEEEIKLQALSKEKAHAGLKYFDDKFEIDSKNLFPKNEYGGIISSFDGRIVPKILMKSLMLKLESLNIDKVDKSVLSLTRLSQSNQNKWKIHLEENYNLITDYVIICSALNSQNLIKPLGHERGMEPILGQAIEVDIGNNINLDNWPSVLSIHGVNLIPSGINKMLVGATLEAGDKPSEEQLKKMQNLYGNAPQWLQSAQIIQKWYGLRARPQNQPSPLIEKLEPGLIINTGHYRNGILLAPACAEWVEKQIT